MVRASASILMVPAPLTSTSFGSQRHHFPESSRSSIMIEKIANSSLPTGADALGISLKGGGSWAACWDRARSFLETPGLLLPWIFGLAFGITYAVMAEDSAGWALTGVLVALMLAVIGASHLKFWVALYPLLFLSPELSLGSWAEDGEKLFGLLLYAPWILILLCLWIPRLLVAKRLELPWNVKIALGGLVGIGFLALWIAPDRLFGLKTGVRTLFEPLLLFTLIASLPWKHAEIRQVVFVFLCVATVAAGVSVLAYTTEGGERGAGGLLRLGSYWEGPNVLAAFLGTVIPIALGWALSAFSRMAVMTGLAAFLTACLALAFTYTRGAWIGVGAALAFMTAQQRVWLGGFLAVLLIILGVLIGPPDILQRAESII